MNLFALLIQIVAVVAESVAASSRFAFPRWDVSSGRTGAVVVMNALIGRFLFFIYGVERRGCWHCASFRFGVSKTLVRADELATSFMLESPRE